VFKDQTINLLLKEPEENNYLYKISSTASPEITCLKNLSLEKEWRRKLSNLSLSSSLTLLSQVPDKIMMKKIRIPLHFYQ
jgi:hypothetical protein